MVSNAFASRKRRPLWEMLVLVAFFLGFALLAKGSAKLGKLRHAHAAKLDNAEARAAN
jgi:hypothetical protein